MGSPNPWAPYDTYRDCSQGMCSYYCPQWCYIIFPPPPPFDFGDQNDNNHDSSTDFSPLIIAVIGILASAFILLSYYTIISKYCRRRRSRENDDSGGGDHPANDNAHQTTASDQSFPSPSSGLEERLIKSIKVYKYKKGDGFVEGSDCSVCLSEFEENEGLRLLPKCNHAFHVPCIDTWLKSHSSCPLCRSNIAPYVTDVMPQPELSATTVSAMEYQSRSNDAAVVIVVEDSESGFREEVFGVEGDEPKTPTGDARAREEEFRDHGVQIQPLRRSVSLNCHAFCHDRLSVADILRAEEEEEEDDGDDLIIRIEKHLELLSMGIGSSSKGELGVDHFKSNDAGGGVLSLVRSPLAMKRSISTGRFMFTRHGKGKNTIIHH